MRRRHCAFAVLALLILCTEASAGTGSANAPGQSPPSNTEIPTITGKAAVGSTLSANPGAWNGPTPAYRYQWIRCALAGTPCALITTATAQTYLAAAGDLGSTLRVTVTASNKNGTSVATSNQTPAIAASGTPVPTTTTTTTSTTTPSTTTTTTPSSTTTTTTPYTTTTTTTTTTPSSTTGTTTTTPTPTLSATGRWYTPTSAFNSPIPASPAISSDSTTQVAWMVQHTGVFMPTIVAPSTYIATSSTPVVTLQKNYPTCNNAQYRIPLDSSWLLGGGGTNDPESSVVVQAPDGSEWDLFKVTKPGQAPKTSSGVTCPATSNWAATVVAYNSPGWTGGGVGYSYRASGTLGGAGVIRVKDTKETPAGGAYDHAISLAFPNTRNTFVAPATSSDGTHTDASSVPMGARIQLDPAFNVEASGLPEWQKQICRTLQKYGMIVVDTGSALMSDGLGSVRYQGYTWPWEPSWASLPSTVVSHFRVLR